MKKIEKESKLRFVGTISEENRNLHNLFGDKKPGFGQEWQRVCEGVRFKAIAFEGITEDEADGAFIEISPGCWMIECILSDSVFVETPIKGKITIIACDEQNNVFVDTFDPEAEGGYSVEVCKGWIMATFAHKENTEPAAQVEYCEPGFNNPTTDLRIVERNASKVEGRELPIPVEFWDKMRMVEGGQAIQGQTFPGNRV